MQSIGTDLIARAADDPAALVTLEPQPDTGRVQAAQSQIDLAQERSQRLDICRPAPLEIHPVSQPSDVTWRLANDIEAPLDVWSRTKADLMSRDLSRDH